MEVVALGGRRSASTFRVDNRAVWRKWLLDFYVDVTNAALAPRGGPAGTVLRYVLPTVGVRGWF